MDANQSATKAKKESIKNLIWLRDSPNAIKHVLHVKDASDCRIRDTAFCTDYVDFKGSIFLVRIFDFYFAFSVAMFPRMVNNLSAP